MTRCFQDTKHWEFGSSDDWIEDNASVSLSFAATADNCTAVNCSAISWICFVFETHSSCITFILAKSLRAKSRWPNSSSVSLRCCFNSLSLDSAGDSVFSKDSNHSSKSKVDCFPSRDLKSYATFRRLKLRQCLDYKGNVNIPVDWLLVSLLSVGNKHQQKTTRKTKTRETSAEENEGMRLHLILWRDKMLRRLFSYRWQHF